MLRAVYIFIVVLFASPCALALDYRIVSEKDIEQMLEEISSKYEPHIDKTSIFKNPYITEFHGYDEDGSYIYYFTNAGHFTHPSVVIERKVLTADGSFEMELQAATAGTREDLEKWVRVLDKPNQSMEAYKADKRALRHICEGLEIGSLKQVRCAEEVAREHPDSHWAHSQLGISYLYAGDELGTRRVFEVLKQKGDWPTVLIMFLSFGVAAMQPEWYEYYQEDIEFGNRVYETQQLLDALGYETGPSRGVVGNELEEAIKAFQRDSNLAVDGKVTEQLLEKLRIWGTRENTGSASDQ
jgi:hypothetical protein